MLALEWPASCHPAMCPVLAQPVLGTAEPPLMGAGESPLWGGEVRVGGASPGLSSLTEVRFSGETAHATTPACDLPPWSGTPLVGTPDASLLLCRVPMRKGCGRRGELCFLRWTRHLNDSLKLRNQTKLARFKCGLDHSVAAPLRPGSRVRPDLLALNSYSLHGPGGVPLPLA